VTSRVPTLAAISAALFLSCGPAAAQERVQYEVHPSTQDPARLVTLEQLAAWETELSNWGRWGPADQRGTFNLITPEKTVQATRLVTDGVTVTLQHFPRMEDAIDSQTFGETRHWMSRVNPETGVPLFALDEIQFSLHDGLLSHVDALCHYRSTIDGVMTIFNGYPQNLDEEGCHDLSIDKMGPGYVTRGVLVDMPLLKGVEWLDPSTPIYIEDLEAWEEYAGVRVEPGDVLLVRTGRWAKRAAEGPWDHTTGGAGLHASVLPWLHARGVSMLVGDAVNDVQPSGVQGINRPIHQLTQVNIGLPLVDNGYLEDVAVEARNRRRWSFMISWQLNAIEGGTASPFNGIATF
jgi:hypothetical protein